MFGVAGSIAICSRPLAIKFENAKTKLCKFYKNLSFVPNSHHLLFLKLLVVFDVSIKASGYIYVVADPIDFYDNGIANNKCHSLYPNHSHHKRKVAFTSYDRVSYNKGDAQIGNSINIVATAMKSEDTNASNNKTKTADNLDVRTQGMKADKTIGDSVSGKKTNDRTEEEDDDDDEKPIGQIEEEDDINDIIVGKDYKGPVFEGTEITLEFMHELLDYYFEHSTGYEPRLFKPLHEKYVLKILKRVKGYYQRKPSLIDVRIARGSNITVVGDIHGKLNDLRHIFKLNGLPSATNSYLFNGDFVDRGNFSVQCVIILFGFKLLYPSRVHLNRGNHESEMINLHHGFYREVKYQYSKRMFGVFNDVFNWLPLAHRINNRVLVLHGGLFWQRGVTLTDIKHIKRGCEPEPDTLMEDLLWSDPKDENGRSPNRLRGAGITFGPDVTRDFCIRNKLDLIIRSHYPTRNGYKVQHNGRLVTVFSASSYSYNKGAFIQMRAPELIPGYITYSDPDYPPL